MGPVNIHIRDRHFFTQSTHSHTQNIRRDALKREDQPFSSAAYTILRDVDSDDMEIGGPMYFRTAQARLWELFGVLRLVRAGRFVRFIKTGAKTHSL